MIISTGIDIIEVARIREALKRTARFVDRVFTPDERAYCDSRGGAAQHYAARFAAKEAALKALGTGWSGGISWHDVEVMSRENGAPYLVLSGGALEVFHRLTGRHLHLSMSHTNEHAIAQVIIER
ncbi:MAG: holo-ACP synthase [Pyrinomonadaceae bacterium]